MRKALLLFLTIAFAGIFALGQTASKSLSATDRNRNFFAGQLEEIAMCHHAIKAAHYDALSLGQNPYYRYILNAPHEGSYENVYPIPERCKSLAESWILQYAKMDDHNKAVLDKSIFNQIGMTISDMATDVQFLTAVISKQTIEGKGAIYLENEGKDIPQNP